MSHCKSKKKVLTILCWTHGLATKCQGFLCVLFTISSPHLL